MFFKKATFHAGPLDPSFRIATDKKLLKGLQVEIEKKGLPVII